MTMRSPAETHPMDLLLMSSFLFICGLHDILGVRISNCNNNKVEIFEDSPAPVTCGDITSTKDVVWRREDGVNIGECSAVGTYTSDLYNDYRLSRSPQSTESQLTLVPDYRRHAGLTVTCWDRASLFTASCTLVIKENTTGVSTATVSLSSSPVLIGPIAGAVISVVVITIIIVVLIIFIRRRTSSKEAPVKTTKSLTCRDSEFDEHINDMYDSSENTGSKGSSAYK